VLEQLENEPEGFPQKSGFGWKQDSLRYLRAVALNWWHQTFWILSSAALFMLMERLAGVNTFPVTNWKRGVEFPRIASRAILCQPRHAVPAPR
jgi:hypothetical protein